MLELRNLLTVNCGEFVKLDDAMLGTKMIPDDLEVPIPRYFVEDAASELQERRRQIAALQAHYKETEVDAPVSKALAKRTAKGPHSQAGASMTSTIMTVDDAVKLLQVNERGRQARQRAKFQMVIYLQQKHALEHANEYSYTAGKERAALVVQKAVQAYLARKHILKDHNKELELLGMRPTAATLSDAERVAAGVRLEERKARQRMNEASYRQKEAELEARLKAEEGPRTMEEMLNEVLTRMAYARMESKDDTPLIFPTPEEGGSRKYLEIYGSTAGAATGTVTAGGAPSGTPSPFSGLSPPDEANAPSRVGSVAVRSSLAGTAVPQTPSRKAGSTIRRRGEGEESLPAMPPSNLWDSMKAADERYQSIWRAHFEQTYLKDSDLDQTADEGLLRRQLLEGPRGILESVRCVVDELIMIEVENLKKRLEMERRGGKKKKGVKKKGPKKPRAPKLKDPTKGVDIETFVNSAVHQNVLQLPDPDIQLENYLGCATVHGSPLDVLLRTQKPDEELKRTWQRILNTWDANVEQAMKMKKDAFQKLFDKFLQQSSWLSEPSAAQVRQCIAEYAILPLGSQVIHDLAPSSKTLLLYGFPGSGKTHLVHAVCNHSGANLFDLSPANFETNTNLVGIIQMVFHLARVLAPSVIYIDKVEKLFSRKKKKKGPKDLLMARGKKMKKEILKGIAALAPTDRVLVIGSSSAPWDAEFNAMVNNFAHMIYCVTPDYASRLILLQKWVAQRTTDVNALKPEGYHELALLTDGLAAGEIQRIVCEVLHARRLRRLAQRPLTASDFLSAVARAKPPSGEEQALMKEFSLRLPLRLRRINPPADLPAPEKKEGGTKRKKVTE
ncbi:hypothetical protein TRSC58_04225 [Trypanosoma rangeli SC58]|uniref:AAA+ ATPase domain-containing protein n=1 Tax=Trypanosoma rangeli SC58 TaxID=429131 RepID=A0A061J1C0_TRYRA|nr:hypothetical protein TRSC58_04225 [Trypanosoma rangeli SC58]